MSTDTPTRVAVVTGASSGIGAATARALAADGHRVALLARRGDRIEQLAEELGGPDRALALVADVTDRDALVAAAQRVQDELGGADVLVNNAGVMLLRPFSSDQREEQQRMVEVNLLGAMTATEVFLDQLRDGGGDLVNISSVACRTARPVVDGRRLCAGANVGELRIEAQQLDGLAQRRECAGDLRLLR
jgi:NADP-dependent 3-hydroxy acid dehydrogenase YdfG